ncbi:acetyltransferase [Phormidium sp. CCY1219]|uniref:acetyltransferase n=1 Tax=Phormidium sp. CCY1219 TaxID=2886104 RepID=UPI002D1F34E2|nr:acetyltransferase [Phormidium sp. CCY1219]MEB3831108.1 acetyltransferase [Phormidium sp. CCY1219]
MSEHSEKNPLASPTQELDDVIAGLQQYRERIVNDVTEMAKKVKLSKKATMAHLEQHPELERIDALLADLRSRKATIDPLRSE